MEKINDFNTQEQTASPSKEEYNSIPVHYCKQCLSLRIVSLVMDVEEVVYCDECGCTEVEQTDIENWERLYENRYGKKFLNQ